MQHWQFKKIKLQSTSLSVSHAEKTRFKKINDMIK